MMFSGFGFQLMRCVARCSGRISMPGCLVITSIASASLFLLAMAMQHAAPREIECDALQIAEERAGIVGSELEPRISVLAHGAAPQRIVEIEHQHLRLRTCHRRDVLPPGGGEMRHGVDRERQARHQPLAIVGPGLAPEARLYVVVVEPRDRALARGIGTDARVESANGVGLPDRPATVQDAERGRERPLEALHENVRRCARPKHREQVEHALRCALDLRLDIALREIGEPVAERRRDIAKQNGQNDGVRLRRVEPACRVEDVLSVGVEIAHPSLDAAAVESRLGLQHRHHGLDGERAQERDAVRRDPPCRPHLLGKPGDVTGNGCAGLRLPIAARRGQRAAAMPLGKERLDLLARFLRPARRLAPQAAPLQSSSRGSPSRRSRQNLRHQLTALLAGRRHDQVTRAADRLAHDVAVAERRDDMPVDLVEQARHARPTDGGPQRQISREQERRHGDTREHVVVHALCDLPSFANTEHLVAELLDELIVRRSASNARMKLCCTGHCLAVVSGGSEATDAAHGLDRAVAERRGDDAPRRLADDDDRAARKWAWMISRSRAAMEAMLAGPSPGERPCPGMSTRKTS